MAETDEVIRVGVRELRGNLSGYLRQARQGRSFVVMSRGQPVAELRAPPRRTEARRPGGLKGRIRMAEDFDSLPDDVLDAIEGAGE